jgi:hypothetical protein
LNLDDSPVTIDEMVSQLRKWRDFYSVLDEVIAIKAGRIVRIWP